MKTDLVDRLRRAAPDHSVWSHERQELLIEAAAEIESLRQSWAEGITKAIGQLKENHDIIKDATERLDRAGL